VEFARGGASMAPVVVAEAAQAPPDAAGKVAVSVVIPAYNEAWRLPAFLDDILMTLDAEREPFEVIVVDDGSTDETAAVVLARARQRGNVRLLRLKRNFGKGAAMRVGMLAARGRLRLQADADGAIGIRQLPKLRQALADGFDVAIGSRAGSRAWFQRNWFRRNLSAFFRGMARALAVPGVRDTQCGFKLYPAATAEDLFARSRENGFAFDVEVLRLAHRRGLRIAEIPVVWRIDPLDRVRIFRDGLSMAAALARILVRRGERSAVPRVRKVPYTEATPGG
jgi:dolichyl-phosphate beta-glucosyltransferase